MTTPLASYQDVSARSKRDELILKNLHLVRHTASRLVAQLPPGLDVENLESAGTLGLVEAAARFDPTRGVKFETFAAHRIRGAMLDELRRNCPLPQHLLEKVAKVRQAYHSLPGPVSVEALAAVSGLSAEDVADCLAALRMTRMLSWDDAAEARVFPQPSPTPAADLDDSEQKKLLADAIARLPERERLVVTLYYLENLRLKEIGSVLKLSESRVSRLLNSGLFHLGEYLRGQGAG